MHIYPRPSETQTKALLAACGLPVEDLSAAQFQHFFGCGSRDQPEGVVGLELYGSAALLRSLAVAENARGRGCAKQLVAAAEAYAAQQGVTELYLLTETASALFSAIGYHIASRESAPVAIRNTREFAVLCSASATFMMKRI